MGDRLNVELPIANRMIKDCLATSGGGVGDHTLKLSKPICSQTGDRVGEPGTRPTLAFTLAQHTHLLKHVRQVRQVQFSKKISQSHVASGISAVRLGSARDSRLYAGHLVIHRLHAAVEEL